MSEPRILMTGFAIGEFETRRLLLRRFAEADVDHLFALHNDPVVMRFINGGKPTPREEVEREYRERFAGDGYWAAVEKSTGEFLGWFGFNPPGGNGEFELGYRIERFAWGKGYATEGSRALIRKGFTELGVRRVFARTMTVNAASRRVMEKAGLAYVRTFHQEWPEHIEGSEQGDVEYALTRAEWERREAGGFGRGGMARQVW
jgi:RimJ/RimL family protein N-acetyltransferase